MLILLGLLDVITALIGIYSVFINGLNTVITTLLITQLIKGAWSIKSFPLSIMGLIDFITPIITTYSIITNNLTTITYLMLTFTLTKGLFSIMSGI